MPYSRPLHTAANATWQGAAYYTRPSAGTAHVWLTDKTTTTGALSASLPANAPPPLTYAATGDYVIPAQGSASIPQFSLQSLTFSATGEVVIQGSLLVSTVIPTFPLTFDAEGYRTELAYWFPIPTQADVTWEGATPYTRPDFNTADAWFIALDYSYGTLSADLPPAPSIALDMVAAGSRDRDWFYISLPAPTIALTPDAAADYIHAPALAVALPVPDLQFTFHARERSIYVTVDAPLPAPSIQMTAAGTADYIHAPALSAPLTQLPLQFVLTAGAAQDKAMTDAAGPHNGRMRFAQADNSVSSGCRVDQQTAQTVQTADRVRQQTAEQTASVSALRATESQRVQRFAKLVEQSSIRIDRGTETGHAEALRVPTRSTTMAWQEQIRTASKAAVDHAETIRTSTRSRQDAQEAQQVANPLAWIIHQALTTANRLGVDWAQMIPVAPGKYWPWYEPPLTASAVTLACDYTPRWLRCTVVLSPEGGSGPECPPCYTAPSADGAHVLWKGLTPYTRPNGVNAPVAQPRWECGVTPVPEQPQTHPTVPVLEVYIVANTFSLVRASDNAPLTASEFSASLDRDSWAWSWSAKIPASQQPLVEPVAGDPIEVIATINGNPLRLVLERITRERRFGEAWLSISGRGRAAWLAEPYAEIVSFANAELRTAQQLMAEALQVNNVPIGWALDWRITDWNVPAGAWSHQGTYMDAVTRIAEAGGAYVQAHDTNQTLIVLPHYPAMPRDWGSLTPDLTLPEAVCETEGIEWIDRPAYNTLWIVGGAGGRKDQIRLTGSAADRPAQTIVDNLATDTQMTRQRGIRVLADTGRQAHISIRLPVLPETGIIHPGQLLDYTEQGTTRRGLVRSVSVQHQFPQVWQSVRIETHG